MHRALIFLLAVVCWNFAFATQPSEVLEPGYTLGKKSAADLTTEWWQWAFSSPEEINPVRDTSGVHCSVGQQGKVWFLAGGFGSSRISRRCVIPSNKYIFFPVINMAYWPRDENSGYTCRQAKTSAAVNNNNALNLFVVVDSIPVKDVKRFRVKTEKCFDIYEKVEKSLQTYKAYPSASDGYWVLLRPLSKGKHTIKFGGGYSNAGNPYGQMVQDIEYEVTVE